MKNIAIIGNGYCGKNLLRNYHRHGVLKTEMLFKSWCYTLLLDFSFECKI